jgi:asparagine synthase (glutamine-hydrolysing)
MATSARGSAFFALIPAAEPSPGQPSEPPPDSFRRLFAAVEPTLGCRGSLSIVSGCGAHALVAGASRWSGEPGPSPSAETGDALVLSVGGDHPAATDLAVVVAPHEVRLRADSLGRRTLHATWLSPVLLAVATTIAPLVAARRAFPDAGKVILDPAAMVRFFTFSYVPAPFTAFAEVCTVPAGHEQTLPRMRAFANPPPPPPALSAPRRWYDVPRTARDESFEKPTDDQSASRLRDEIVRSLQSLAAPTGLREPAVLLSGGLDSALVAWAARHVTGPTVATVTFDFEEDSEGDAAAAIAEALGIGAHHERVPINGAEALTALQQAARALDTPIGDPVVVPFTHLAHHTAHRAFLTGEGGDQILAGWATKPMFAWARYAGPDDSVAEAYVGTFHKFHDVKDEAFGPTLRAASATFRPAADLEPFLDDARSDRHDGFFHLLADANVWLKGAGNILPRIDRCLGSAGLEALHPLLDHRFVAAAFASLSTQKQRGNTEKWILRHALAGALPPAILDLPKRGMRVPVTPWLLGPLRSFATDMLTSSRFRRRGWLEDGFVQRLLAGEVRSPDLRRRRRDEWLWMALFAAVWAEAHDPS